MSSLLDNPPKGWKQSTMGKVGRYLNGYAFSSKTWGTTGRPIIRIQNLTGSGSEFNYFNGDIESRYIVRPGDLLFSWAATLGVYVWSGPEAVLNQHIFKVESFLDKSFHRYLIEASIDEMKSKTHGTGMVHITKKKFDEIPVLIPPSDEQKEIVRILEEQFSRLGAATASIAAVRRKAEQFRRSALFQSLMGEGQPDSGSVGRGDSGWLSGELGDFCEMYQPRTISTKQLVTEGAYPVFGANGIIGRYDDYNHEESEVTVTCRGATCGTVNVTPAKCWITGNSMVVRPKDSRVSRPYLKYVLSALDFSQVITGTAQPQITRASLSRAKVRFAPMEQQSVIVALLDAAESDAHALSAMAETTKVRLAQLRRSLLHAAFSGELTTEWRKKNND